MHVFVGLLGLAAVFWATIVAGQSTHNFTGFLHKPALILLCLAPPFIAVISYRLEELLDTLRSVAQALRRSPSRARAELFDDLTRFATEVRRGRPVEALSAAEHAFEGRASLGIASQDVKLGFLHALEALLALGDRDKANELLTTAGQRAEDLPVPRQRQAREVVLQELGIASPVARSMQDGIRIMQDIFRAKGAP